MHLERMERGLIRNDNKKKYRSLPSQSLTMASRLKAIILNMKVSQLIAFLVVIGITVFLVRFYTAQPPSEEDYGKYKFGQNLKMEQHEMDKFMRAVQDTRPTSCVNNPRYSASRLPKVSIIMHYNEHQFYNAKLALHSVIEHTPEHLFQEILLLDDGSSKYDLRAEVQAFLSTERYSKKVKGLRSERVAGEASSKFKASKMAEGEVLVFLSCQTVVNVGWLEPLLEAVMTKPNMIATPHVDNLLSGFRFFPNKHNLINVFSWTLTTYKYERPDAQDPEDTSYVTQPVLRGEAFAMKKQYLQDLGEFDIDFKPGGGHMLELSLRTWLCGGQIKIIPCSRVAVHDALKPLPITNQDNLRRVTELWLPMFKFFIYEQAMVKHVNLEEELKTRKTQLQQAHYHSGTDCHSGEWFLQNVFKEMTFPRHDMINFGTLSTQNGYCVFTHHRNASLVSMVQCRPHTYDPLKVIEMTDKGQIMCQNKCLEFLDNERIVFSLKCDANNADQLWAFDGNHISLKRDERKCLTHMQDLNAQRVWVHSLNVKPCEGRREQRWSFVPY